MGFIARLLGILLAAVAALAIVAVIWLQDANRLKPELEALLSDNSDFDVSIAGDVSWQLWPPLILEIEDVTAKDKDQTIVAKAIHLKMDLSAMWEDIERWQVSELNLTNTTITDADAKTTLHSFTLKDFQFGVPAPFTLDVSYEAQGEKAAQGAEAGASEDKPITATAQGLATYHPATDEKRERFSLDDVKFVSNYGDGLCSLDATPAKAAPTRKITEPIDEEILPLTLLHAINAGGTCALTGVELGGETFNDVAVEFGNLDGKLDTLIEVRDFMDGSATVEVDVDTYANPVKWTVLPEINNVDSQRLIDWSDQRLTWIAHVGANSSLTLYGNTPDELAASVKGTSEFDGGQGQLNIEKIKAQLMRLAQLSGRAERVAEWPDLWEYQHFSGRWQIDGHQQILAFALDNMSVDAEGEYNYLDDSLDLLGNVTIHELAEGVESPFSINPLLAGTPIPIRCRGAASDPTCSLDQDAARNLIARAFQRDDESGLRNKLEEKIDEEVPEEYREVARDLLDILGRSLERD